MKNLILILLLVALPAAAQPIRRNSATTNAVPVAHYVDGVLTNSLNTTGGITNNNAGFWGNAVGLTNLNGTNLVGILTNALNTTTGGITNRSSGFWGNGTGLTNLNGTNLVGIITNALNTTTGGITNRSSGFWGNATGLTNLHNIGWAVTTNVAPSNVDITNRPPDSWMIFTGTNAVIYYIPLWIPH